jgi:hypothetical protein
MDVMPGSLEYCLILPGNYSLIYITTKYVISPPQGAGITMFMYLLVKASSGINTGYFHLFDTFFNCQLKRSGKEYPP